MSPGRRRLGAIHSPRPPSIPPLAKLARLNLMQAPPETDWNHLCPANGDLLGNDLYGCCVPVAEYHAIEVHRAVIRKDTWRATEAEVLQLYTDLTGFDLATGQPDVGTDTAAAMAAWSSTGITPDPQNEDVPHWSFVRPDETADIRLAIYLTGPVQVTVNLPAGAEEDIDAWSRAPGIGADWEPGSWGMHRIMAGRYDGDMFYVRTWGVDLAVHPEFWARYAVAVDITLSRQWFDTTGRSPAGLDWDTLHARYGQIGEIS